MIAVMPERLLVRSIVNQKIRVQSIDIMRGMVMIIMALDHVRDFVHADAFTDSPTNLATTTPVLFFTRWITNFCAPVFIFLSGLSAFIAARKKTKKELSLFLIKRGLWLVIVELTIIAFSWSFNPAYNMIFLQVIWATGWSMVILGLLVRMPGTVIIITGCVLFFFHNLLDYVSLPQNGVSGLIWNILLRTSIGFYKISDGTTVVLLYAILPWTSFMLLGYSFGNLYQRKFSMAKRKQLLLITGCSLCLLFIILRFINLYGDPSPWSTQKNTTLTILSFLNVTKYPVSLQYGCMTLGPLLILLALTEQISNRFTRFVINFGKVPFFYYILHFFLIHLITTILFFASGHGWNEAVDPNAFLLLYFRPANFGFNLWVVYGVWLFVIAALYFPCKWFSEYKREHKEWWLQYL